MRNKSEIQHDLVKSVGEGKENELIYLMAEIMMDIRDLLIANNKNPEVEIQLSQ